MEGWRGELQLGKQKRLDGRVPSRMGGISCEKEEGEMESTRISSLVAGRGRTFMAHGKHHGLEELWD